MFESILSALVELGLLGADFIHYRKVEKLEEKAGKKYPFKKYLLMPSIKLFFGLLILGMCLGFGISIYRNKIVNPRDTVLEMKLITVSANNWKNSKGTFPEEIKQLIGGRPYRKTWPEDEWGKTYFVDNTSDGFIIISAGPDKIHGTEDDINGNNSVLED